MVDRKFEVAPRDRLRFTEEIEALVLRILRHSEALVSDESILWNFCVRDAEDGVLSGRGRRWYFFKTKWLARSSSGEPESRHLPEICFYIRANMPEQYRQKLRDNSCI